VWFGVIDDFAGTQGKDDAVVPGGSQFIEGVLAAIDQINRIQDVAFSEQKGIGFGIHFDQFVRQRMDDFSVHALKNI